MCIFRCKGLLCALSFLSFAPEDSADCWRSTSTISEWMNSWLRTKPEAMSCVYFRPALAVHKVALYKGWRELGYWKKIFVCQEVHSPFEHLVMTYTRHGHPHWIPARPPRRAANTQLSTAQQHMSTFKKLPRSLILKN